ncbi:MULTISPECIES: type 4a pilus biogenesis protein PilO [unclassified Pseudomonas]|uniref:type 4a pilus biogenesis protein PilO n=1 Tax=unclassified Pseudomonas TaxID=196821 RepID=UPI000BA4A04B|nr:MULTISPECIES: type 4a pilus biogenesis protein PilO [unclassified Pseudomonas]
MSLVQWFDAVRKVDINELDLNNIGSWPAPVKVLVGALVMVLVLVLGYNLQLRDLDDLLGQARAGEASLKAQFSSKAQLAANLEPYTEQMKAMESAFGVLLRQLPGDTEVPGLLEDISRTGLGSGLAFEEIKLLPEVARPFYIELPIQITVTGDFHDLATFVSGVAGLPRIVTLHDFSIEPVSPGLDARLRMSILARTYRYNDTGRQP